MDSDALQNLISSVILLCSSLYILILIYHLLSHSSKNNGMKKPLQIYVVTNEDECIKVVSRLWTDILKSDKCALGFDCEWISQPKWMVDPQPISLLQLCSSLGTCGLFRLNELQHIPNSLQVLLMSDIIKLGVNCDNDARLIKQNYGVQVNNFLDLRHLFSVEASLAKLSQNTIGVTLTKEPTIVCSNWNQKTLSKEQIEYAANDAWAAIEIFKAWSEDKSEEYVESQIQLYQNTPFKRKKTGKGDTWMVQKENQNESIPLKVNFARKTPLYDNCWMYAPDDQVLCSCDKRKAHWYIQKGLAEVTCQNPFSIRLLFEPNSRPGLDTDGDFYREFKKNCCVVCGTVEPCMKLYVMPREYRKHFPDIMKSHQSHDIVLTCLLCHAKSKIYMQQLKEELANLCDAPIYVPESSHYKQYKKIKNVCTTLLNSGNNIPPQRRQYLEESVKKFLGLMDINNDILQGILSEKIVDDKRVVTHGAKVVEYFKGRKDGLIELEVLWRKKFIDNMKPHFLPSAWSINHNHKIVSTKL